MKKLLMVLLMTVLAMAATSSLATTDAAVNASAEKVLSLSALGPGDFTDVAIPLAAPVEALLSGVSTSLAADTCPWLSCCDYYWDNSTKCCVPQVPSCGGFRCAALCKI